MPSRRASSGMLHPRRLGCHADCALRRSSPQPTRLDLRPRPFSQPDAPDAWSTSAVGPARRHPLRRGPCTYASPKPPSRGRNRWRPLMHRTGSLATGPVCLTATRPCRSLQNFGPRRRQTGYRRHLSNLLERYDDTCASRRGARSCARDPGSETRRRVQIPESMWAMFQTRFSCIAAETAVA